jgi:hypothetical protein
LPEHEHLFGAAVILGGECSGIEVKGNAFDMPWRPEHREPVHHRLVYGCVQVPALVAGAEDDRAFLPILDDAEFSGNRFSGLTAAMMVRAAIGSVRVDGNRVRDCDGGFWISSLGTSPLRQWLDNIRHPEAKLVFEEERINRGAWFARFFRVTVDVRQSLWVRDVHPAGAEVEASTVEETRPSHPILDWILRRHEPHVVRRPGARCLIRVTNNEVDLRRRHDPSAVLLVSDAGYGSSVVVASNYLAKASRNLAVALVLSASRTTCTGNVILNEEGDDRGEARGRVRWSLIVEPLRGHGNEPHDIVAITGNVFEGEAGLPERKRGLPEWRALNDLQP